MWLGFSVFAQYFPDTSVSSAPRIIESKTIEVPDNYSLNDVGGYDRWVVILVELREETGGSMKGHRYGFKTVIGVRVVDKGNRIEGLGSQQQFYQQFYGGTVSVSEYYSLGGR